MTLTQPRHRGRFLSVSGTIVALVAAFAAPSGTSRADVPASRPPATQAVVPADGERKIAEAIILLGSGDFQAREDAAKFLWSMGDRAVPALKAAVAGDDPEVARRAKTILDNAAYGLRPDTPKVVLDLLGQYRAARNAERKQVVVRALAEQDVAGARVLLKLAQDETDPNFRQLLIQTLVSEPVPGTPGSPVVRTAVPKLLDEGDDETAREMLKMVAGEQESASRDFAAFLVLRGGIDDEIKRLAAIPRGTDVGQIDVTTRLVHLYRAKGDVKGALDAAMKSEDMGLLELMLVEAGDWKALASQVEKRVTDGGTIEELGYLTAYYRLSGNAAEADKYAARVERQADHFPNKNWDVAESLLLNDRAAQAMAVLKRNKNYTMSVEFLAPRLEFKEALETLERAKLDQGSELGLVKAKVATALHFMGRNKEAAGLVNAVANGEDGTVDFGTYLELIDARGCGMPQARVDELCLATLRMQRAGRPQEALGKVFEHGGFDRADQEAQWWEAIRDTHAGEPPAVTFARLRAMDRKELSKADVTALTTEARDAAAPLPAAQRDARLVLVADTLAEFDRAGEAIDLLEKLVESSESPTTLTRLGDLYAGQKKWDAAAGAYARAYGRDRTQALPLLLRGWAMQQGGHAKEAQAFLDRAHLIPLADEAARHALMTELLKRGLAEEAARERDLLLRTAEFSRTERGDALRRAGEDLVAKGEFLAAADVWDRAFLNNLSERLMFIEPQANLLIPVMIHRTRAQGLIKAGRIDEAVKEADLCFQNCPGDADSQIEIVTALQDAGHAAQADAIYGRAKSLYEKLAGEYPESGPAHNLSAWFEGKCKRDLDGALAHAKKAAELEPESTAILDTLAEVYFQRGEIEPALELVHKCLKLEPGSEHHRKNLERFEAAKAGNKPAR